MVGTTTGIQPHVALAVDSRCTLGESIVWCDREQVLWWTDIKGKRIWRAGIGDQTGQWWSTQGRVGSLALCESGRLLLGMERALYFADPRQHEPGTALTCELLAEVPMEGASMRINDGRVDRSGNFVFGGINEAASKSRLACFHQFSLEHGLRPLALEPVTIANGIAFDPSGRQMYYCDSLQGRIMKVGYDAALAQVGAVEVFATVDVDAEPDGAMVDGHGRLWGAQWGAGRVVRYSATGEVDLVVPVPATQPTCVTFGGAGQDALFITSARDGLDDAQLGAQPTSGGVFAAALDGPHATASCRFMDS